MARQFDIARSGFVIRAAAPGDARAVRMLLPQLYQGEATFVAVCGASGLVVGAAAMTGSRRRQPLVGPGVAMRVIEPCRRCGIGRGLLEAIEQAAGATGAAALYAAQRVVAESDEERGWQWLGFRECDTIEEHLLPLDQFEPRLAPLVERMRAKGRIPATARIIPLYQADRAAVLELHLAHMGGDRATLERKLHGIGPGAFLLRYSQVLVIDDAVKGCILGHRQTKEIMAVDANILAPDVRGSWANVWLKLEATRGALSLGITHFHFTTFDHYSDTRSFTGKLGGVTTRRRVLMFRPID